MNIYDKKTKKIFNFEHWQVISLLLRVYDIVAVNLSYFLALWVRFDLRFSHIPEEYLTPYIKFVPIYTLFCLVIFTVLRLYRSIWRFASYNEFLRVVLSSAITGVFHIVAITVLLKRMPISYYLMGMMIQFMLILGIRFSYRFILLERSIRGKSAANVDVKNVMIIGAGSAGQMIIQDINKSRTNGLKIVCIIDDNPNKWKRYIYGIPIVGGRDDILKAAQDYKVDKIYLAIPSASPETRRDILNICKETGCEMKNLPGVYQFVNGDVTVNEMKDVAIEDLLGRNPVKIDDSGINDFLKGKVVLITGGGGSIGSELCRQIATYSPKLLIIFDVYENNAYDIQQELREKHPDLNLKVLIGSIRDSSKVNSVFETYKPDIVYHAAAHKHVPLMEDSPCEAIKNNAIGTYKVAYAAMVNGCSNFILISTDKAVNPTNIMGASKRLCEMIIQTFDYKVSTGHADDLPLLHAHMLDEDGDMSSFSESRKNALKETPHTRYVAVRFGNVLGSNGSVVPLFKKQIANGGPVTVTHPDIIRYFMTIPEAVSLVLQTGVLAKGSEIFVLNMGSPVKIDNLARNLIKLSGYKPDVDIKIEYTGLRPGEKLYEEKLMAEEGLKTTENDHIHIGKPIEFDYDTFILQLKKLMDTAYENDPCIVDMVKFIVPTFHPERANRIDDKEYEKQIEEVDRAQEAEKKDEADVKESVKEDSVQEESTIEEPDDSETIELETVGNNS